MAEQTNRKKWSDVKARLETLDRKSLVSLLGDLTTRAWPIAASITRA
jgi:hypothetical protein